MVALDVQRLCDELGCSNELAKSPGVHADVGHKSGLLTDIRQLLLENKTKDQHIEVLHAAVNGLVDVVHEDVRQNAEARDAMSKSLPPNRELYAKCRVLKRFNPSWT